MHLCVCVSEEGRDGEVVDSETLSDTLRCISLDGLVIGLVYDSIKRELKRRLKLFIMNQ